MRLFQLLKKCVFLVREKITDIYATKSYSQEGEDMILRRLLEGTKCGFYVDVGAHHPKRFSNSYFFYKQGWRGINIEPNPDVINIFSSIRKRDINLQLGVSDSPMNLTYFMFNDPALNTFDEKIVKNRLDNTPYRIVAKKNVPVERLDYILEKYLPKDTQIDFLSIDVEGFDIAVLKSNDWNRYRPKYVLVEELDASLEDVIDGEIFQYMKSQQYKLLAKSYNTLFFLNVTPND